MRLFSFMKLLPGPGSQQRCLTQQQLPWQPKGQRQKAPRGRDVRVRERGCIPQTAPQQIPRASPKPSPATSKPRIAEKLPFWTWGNILPGFSAGIGSFMSALATEGSVRKGVGLQGCSAPCCAHASREGDEQKPAASNPRRSGLPCRGSPPFPPVTSPAAPRAGEGVREIG